MKLILSVCHDNNYKIRRDGVIFLKEYFKLNKAEVVKGSRLQNVYLNELIDFINDEDSHIRIDAIEAFAEILDHLEEDIVLQEFVP